ncbi:MAG: hypothetical protein KF864_00275 [Phycisphaeraceae bacterium]|nr:hypothetical protein [Phycisphaeraceae bacterium]
MINRALHLFGGMLLLSAVSCSPRDQVTGSPAVVTENKAGAGPATPLYAAPLVMHAQPWTLEGPDGKLITTNAYRLYTTSTKSFIVDNLPPFLESALAHYTSVLGHLPLPTEPLEVYVMDTRPQWERMTQRFMGEQAHIYLRIQKGGFTSNGRAILYDIGRRDTFAITAHEAWHVYTQRTFKNPLPVWLEEGLATYMEGFRWDTQSEERPRFLPWANFERFDQLRWGVRAGRLMPLDTLVQSTPQQLISDDLNSALFYYAQVWGIVHFLAEGADGKYRAPLFELISDAAHGRLVPRIQREHGGRAASAYLTRKRGVDLFSMYFGVSATAMEAEYQAFVQHITTTGTRQHIWQGLSPLKPAPTFAPRERGR